MPNSREFQQALSDRAGAAGVSIDPALGERLEVYFRLLAAWSSRLNLSGMDLSAPTPAALDRLLIEPVAAAAHAPSDARRMIDVGSGGGSPAIPFALAVSGIRLLMVESRSKKSVFLREAVRTLGLGGSEVVTGRFEVLASVPEYADHDILTIRAVAVDRGALRSLRRFLNTGGHIFQFVGPVGEAFDLPPELELTGSWPLVPALGSQVRVLRAL